MPAGGRAAPQPSRRDHLARQPQRVGIVLGQVFPQPRDVGVHERATQFLVGGDLAGGGFEQGRSGEKRSGAAAHHHHVVGEPGHVGPARGRGSVHHGNHGNACCRQAREIVEQRAAADEKLHPVLEQVGAGGFDQVQERQLALQSDRLRAQHLLRAQYLKGAGVDAGVAGHDHDSHAVDITDAADHRAAGNGGLGIGHIVKVAGQRRQLQPGCARIEQSGQALARQQLPALFEQWLRPRRRLASAPLERAQALDQAEHVGAITLERLAGDV